MSFRLEPLPSEDKLLLGSTQATVDLTHDLAAGEFSCSRHLAVAKSFSSFPLDLFLTIDNNNRPRFRIYELPIAKFKLIEEYDPPPGVVIAHLSTFADIGE